MPKETGTIDLKAQKAAHDAAARKATDYISSFSNAGIWVTPEDAKPGSDGQATSATTGWHIADALELIKGGITYIKAWLNGSTPTIRLGQDASGHVDVTPDGMEVFTDADTSMASFGATSRIGKEFVSGASDNESHMELDYHSIQGICRDGTKYFWVSDLRDEHGEALVTEQYVGDGTARSFPLGCEAINEITEVTVNGVVQPDTSYHLGAVDDMWILAFDTAPATNSEISVTYVATSTDAFAFTMGYGRRGSVAPSSYAFGLEVEASGFASHAEGSLTKAKGWYAHAEGSDTTASGNFSHAEGSDTTASGILSHAEGSDTTASGAYSHAEGYRTTASEMYTHAEGYNTEASGMGSHAEGWNTIARGSINNYYMHAEGLSTKAIGNASHAEGYSTNSWGPYSHAEGIFTLARGVASHAGNRGTTAYSDNQTALGKYNVEDANDTYAVIVGNGTADDARSNALAVTWDGDVELGTARSSSIKAANEVILNPIYKDATQYRMCFTGAGNIRMEKSTDYGSTWATDTYFMRGRNSLPSSTTTVANVLTPVSGVCTITNVNAAVYGRICMIHVTIKLLSAQSAGNIGNVALATMNSNYYPLFAAALTSSSTGPLASGYISTDHKLYLAALGGAVAANNEISLAGTYILAN